MSREKHALESLMRNVICLIFLGRTYKRASLTNFVINLFRVSNKTIQGGFHCRVILRGRVNKIAKKGIVGYTFSLFFLLT